MREGERMSYYQYRITISDAQGRIESYAECASHWERIVDPVQERGYQAKMERRLITDTDILPLLTGKTGWIVDTDENLVVSPWEVLAAVEG